jgi:hypothetical protein
MLNPSDKEAIDKVMIVPWIIWGALLISLFIYILVCHLVHAQGGQNIRPDFPLSQFRNILYIIAGITLIASYLIRILLLNTRLSSSTSIEPITSQLSTQPAYLGKYMVAMISSLAFCESVGIYGVVLFFVGDSFQTLYTFIGVAAIAMVYYRPKMEELIALANESQRNISHTPNP